MDCIKNSAWRLAEKAFGWKIIINPEFLSFLNNEKAQSVGYSTFCAICIHYFVAEATELTPEMRFAPM